MLQQFKSMNELVEYLGRVENRLKSLEEENRALRAAPAPADNSINGEEMVEYLQGVEGRLKSLEEENSKLRAAPAPAGSSPVEKETIAKYVAYFIPQTSVIHPSFLRRAFAIWGHFFVANFIISLPFMILYFCLLTMVFNQLQPPR